MAKSVIDIKILGDNKGLKGALDDSEGRLKSWAGSVGKVAATAATAAGALVATALGKGFLDASSAELGQDLIQGSLGISEAEAAEIGKAASGAYRSAWGDSLAEVQETAAGVFSSFDEITDLQGLTSKAEALGAAFKFDVTQGVQAASELVSSGLATSADEAFDLLAAGLQKMPAGIRDELLAASNEYGDFFNDLGFTGNQTFSLLTKFAKDGVYGIDKFGDAIKEVSIRSVDGSAASVSALMAAGLEFDDVANRMLSGGETASEAFAEIVSGLVRIEDPAEQAQAAIALFGTPLEDLSTSEIPGFLEALEQTGNDLGDVTGAAQELADTLGGNARTRIEEFKRKALGRLSDFVGDKVIPVVSQLGGAFVSAFSGEGVTSDGIVGVAERIGVEARKVVEFFKRNWPQIKAAVAATVDFFRTVLLPGVVGTMTAIVAAVRTVVDFVRDNWSVIKPIMVGAITGVAVAAASVLIPAFILWATTAGAAAVATIAAAAPLIALGAAVAAVAAGLVYAYENFEGFREVVDAVAAFMVDTVKPAFEDTFEFIIDTAAEVVAFVKDNWPKIRKVIDTAMTAIETVVKSVLGVVERLWETFGGNIQRIVASYFTAVQGVISGALEAIRGVIKFWTSLFKGDWDGVWAGLKQIVSGTFTAIKAILKGALAIVRELLVAGWKTVRLVTSAAWEGIKTAVSTAITGAVDLARGLPGRILSALGNLGGILYQAGRDLVFGFMDGIGSLAGALKDKAKSVIVDGPKNLVKSALGIFSPSRVFADYGRDVVAGFAVGLDDDREVRTQVSNLTDVSLITPDPVPVGDRRPPERGQSFPDRLTLIIEGRPFTAMLAEHDRNLVAGIRAGAR